MSSRQYAYQQRMKAAGRCIKCGGTPLSNKIFCSLCRDKQLALQRKAYIRKNQG